MLYQELIELKFDSRDVVARQEAVTEDDSRGEDHDVSTGESPVVMVAAVLGNTVAGFFLLAGLVLAPLWLERLLTLLP